MTPHSLELSGGAKLTVVLLGALTSVGLLGFLLWAVTSGG